MCVCVKIFVLLVIATSSTIASASDRVDERKNTRRAERDKSDISTSSSGEGGYRSSRQTSDESLGISIERVSSQSSSAELSREEQKITGWRKYHRICQPCPKDMDKKPTDKSISWICGGYQRARRTFKSVCMMRLRNCQDGTMFVKLYDGFCKAPEDGGPLGDHFFYDDKERDSEEDTFSSKSSSKED